jgi:hypothetical protein
MGLLWRVPNIEFPTTYNHMLPCTRWPKIPSKQRVASSSLAGRAIHYRPLGIILKSGFTYQTRVS